MGDNLLAAPVLLQAGATEVLPLWYHCAHKHSLPSDAPFLSLLRRKHALQLHVGVKGEARIDLVNDQQLQRFHANQSL